MSSISPQSMLDSVKSLSPFKPSAVEEVAEPAEAEAPAAAEPSPPPATESLGLRSRIKGRISAYIWATAPTEAEPPQESTHEAAESPVEDVTAAPGRVARVRDAADVAFGRVKSIVSDTSPLRLPSESTLNAEKAAWLSSMFSSRAEQAATEQAAMEQEAAEKAAAEQEVAAAASWAAYTAGDPTSTPTQPSPAPHGLFSIWKQGQRNTDEELQLEQPVALDLPEVSPRKQRASLFARFQRGGEGAADGKWASCFDVSVCAAPRKAAVKGKDAAK